MALKDPRAWGADGGASTEGARRLGCAERLSSGLLCGSAVASEAGASTDRGGAVACVAGARCSAMVAQWLGRGRAAAATWRRLGLGQGEMWGKRKGTMVVK